MFSSLSRLIGLGNSKTKKSRRAGYRASERRLRFESLEGRELLAGVDLGWVVPFDGVGIESSVGIRANDVAVDAAGNSVVTGSLGGTADFDPSANEYLLTGATYGNGSGFVAKYDPDGDLLWAIAFSGSTGCAGLDIDASGSIYVAGQTSGPAAVGAFDLTNDWINEVYAAKIDANGVVLWASVDDDYLVRDVAVDSQGRVTIVGNQMTQFDNLGVPRWSQAINVRGGGSSVAVDSADNLIVGTQFVGTIEKYTSGGARIWSRSFAPASSGGSVSITDVDVDGNDNVYSTGGFSGTVDFDPGNGKFNLKSTNMSAFVSKLTPAGNFVWAKQFSGGANSAAKAWDLAIDAGNNVYLVGGFSGTVDFNPGSGVANRTSKNPSSNWNQAGDDGFLVKLDSAGNFLFVETVGGGGSFEPAQSIAVSDSGTIKIVGKFQGTIDFDPDPMNAHLVSTLPTAKLQSYLWSLDQT